MNPIRTITLCLFLFQSVSAFSQELPIDEETQRVSYSEVVQCENLDREKIYDRVLVFYKDEFKTGDLNLNDQQNGVISTNGSFPLPMKTALFEWEYQALYTFTVKIKDGRYKYIIDDFRQSSVEAEGSAPTFMLCYSKTKKKIQAQHRASFHKETTRLINKLKGVVQTGKIGEDTEDW